MTPDQVEAQRRIERLHAEEEREKQIARSLPAGPDRDEHWMRGERLSDEAWSIEETADLDPRESGVWPRA